MAILLTTDNDSCYIEATNIPVAYVSDGVNGYYKSAFGNYPSLGVALIFDAPTTVTVHNPSASTLSTTQFGNYYLCAYTINWFAHNSYTSLVEEAPYFDNETDFRAWVFTNTPPPVVYNSGGAGSGYIGNPLVSNKKMVGYNVPTSSAEGTKTESVNDVSASAVSGKPKSGNGFARIKFLREPPSLSYKNAIILPENSYSVKGKNTETTYTMSQIKQTFSNNNIILLLYDTNGYIALPMSASSGWALKMASGQFAKNDGQLDWFYGFNNTANPLYPHYLSGGSMPVSWSLQYTTIDNVQYYDDAYTGGTEEHPAILICSLSEFDIYKDGVFDRHYINS